LPPAIPFTLHVTAVFDVLATVAVNDVVWEALNVAAAGVIVTVIVLLLEFPPPHPVRKTLETVNSRAAIEIADGRKICRRDKRDWLP
jgi:hypothetical protein